METLLRDVRHALRMFRQGGASFIVTAVIAAWLPAQRATRVDPSTALRQS